MKKFVDFSIAMVALCVSACAPAPIAPVPPHVYIVCGENPSDSMVVQFHTAAPVDSIVRYDTQRPVGGAAWRFAAEGTSRQIPGLPDARHIHAVPLSGLEPETQYYCEASNGASGSFRTLPEDDTPVRIIFGGDMGETDSALTLKREAAELNPDVVVIGGDIAYDDGELENIGLWDIWFQRWEDIMQRDDGTMIPIVAVIGNHEINESDSDDPAVFAPFYHAFFEQGGDATFFRDLGPELRVIALDSDYMATEEEQVPFLMAALASGEDKQYLVADYHVALYPTVNSFDQDHPTAGRKHWQPHFEAADLTVAFEHHDHAFKRTKPILGDKVDPGGVVYLGDGCMGQEPRDVDNAGAWYLEKASSTPHFWVADVSPETFTCRAINEQGEAFDEVVFAPRMAAVTPAK